MPTRPAKHRSARPSAKPLVLDGTSLTTDDVAEVARLARPVRIAPAAIKRMLASRRVVEAAVKGGDPHYGINTGFGSLSKTRINDADLAALQRNLVRSHAAGVGPALDTESVRGMMLLLAASLARGFSGVRPIVAQTIVDMLNAGVTPTVPSVGSVGASGDLAPLAAIALVAIGEGRAHVHEGAETSGAVALRKAGVQPLTLAAKEGLALINGTHLMAAQAALLATDAERLIYAALVALAMSIDACRASHSFLDERLAYARNGVGNVSFTSSILRDLLKGSTIRESHRHDDPRVQDPYSLRAAPTVLGAVQWHVFAMKNVPISFELGAVTDNPLVFAKGARVSVNWGAPRKVQGELSVISPDDAIISGANFHGMPLAIPLDCLAIALCHLAGIAERRVYLMTGAFEPESHLKPFLAPRPGLQSGLMIAQYTAAACVNEMVNLATPASVANIPTSAGMEDYNSFGPRSAAKARRSLELAQHVVAIELLCAAQGLEYHRPLKSGKAVEKTHAAIRAVVPPLADDRPLTSDIEAIVTLIRSGAIVQAAGL